MSLLARFLPSGRSDASAKIGPKGDICGRSHISKSFDCHKGAGGDRTAPKNVSSLLDDLNKFKDGKLAVSDLPKSWADADLFDEPLSIKDYFEGTLSQEEGDRPRYDQYLTEEIHPKGSNKYIVDDGAGVPWLVQKSGDKWAAQPTGFTKQQADEYLKPFGEDADLILASARNSKGAIAKDIARAKSRVKKWAVESGAMGQAMHTAYKQQLKMEEAADNPDLRIHAQYNDPERYDSLFDRFYREDRKQVINSAGKIPGKKCKGGWISASYKCSDESSASVSVQDKGKSVRKLTAAGKESAQDLAARVRKQRGLKPLAAKTVSTGGKLAIAPQPKQKPQDPIIAKLMDGPVTAKKLEDAIAQISKGKLDDDVLRKVAIAHAARNAPRGQKAGEKLEAWELNNMKASVLIDRRDGIQAPSF
jgi:hypothetical protein